MRPVLAALSASSSEPAYTDAGEVKVITSAYGTSRCYSPDGKQATVANAKGNVTSYAYDGFDRPLTTTYVGGSYEQLGYDANSNVTSRRLSGMGSRSGSAMTR